MFGSTRRGVRRLLAVGVLGMLAWAWTGAAVLAAEAPPLPPGGGGVPPAVIDDFRDFLARIARGSDFYDVPENCRNPDGTYDQDKLVALQKVRLERINKRLVLNLQLVETPHYLIFSDANAATTANFVKWCEGLYVNLGRQFAIPPAERVWDGKCNVLLFSTRTAFEMYARTFDMHDAGGAAAYFVPETFSTTGARLVHMCIPVVGQTPRRLQELFAHEGTHAFFMLYRTPGRLPLWLNEGLAVYMTTVNDKALRSDNLRPASAVANRMVSIGYIFRAGGPYSLDWEDYCVCFTLVEFLLTAGRPKFKMFVDGLKDGKRQEVALKEAYGFDLTDLERRWQTYVNDYARKVR